MAPPEMFQLFCQVFYGFFAVCLLVYPAMFWVDSAVVPVVMTFWSGSLTTQTEWFARSMGNRG